MVIMILLPAMALRTRSEADRRRVTADERIGELLTQVRGELDGTGNVKLMVAVNPIAMDDYGKQGDLRRQSDVLASSSEGRVIATMPRALLHLSRALRDPGEAAASELAEVKAIFGVDAAAKAKSMRAKILANQGEKR